ncbi:chloride channel protein [Thalassotalea fusca]
MTVLQDLRKHLALPQTSWQLCLLAAIGGVASAFLVVLFILSINHLMAFFAQIESQYITVEYLSRFELPFLGALIILLFATLTGYKYLRTGIPFVLHQLKVRHGVIPFRNTLHQFVGSAVALASGFSVGKEGPAVHLGAACSGFIGSKLNLPNSAIRTLSACGIAAGISACFNTPIAAVIFVMEVILREYKVHIFIPVMIASIMGSMITSSVLGPSHEFEYLQPLNLSMSHYPIIIGLGIILGILAYVFNQLLVLTIERANKYPIYTRFVVAALITGALSIFIPFSHSMAFIPFDLTVEQTLTVKLLSLMLAAKIIMTVAALGLGIPGGVVGPILTIGAITGVSASVVAQQFLPGAHLHTDYALIGMAGFMAATLNAPLAALLAVVELSNQLEIIVPAMIVITTSCVASGQFFKNRSIFVMQLEVQGLSYRKPPIEKSLQRIGVLGIMNTQFNVREVVDEQALVDAKNDIENESLQVLKKQQDNTLFHILDQDLNKDDAGNIKYYPLFPISSQATLAEAYRLLINNRHGGVYVYENTTDDIIGIVPFQQIRRYLLEGKTR